MDNYTLGIIWSIGSFQDNRFVFRYSDRYFLEQIQKYCNNSIYEQVGTSDKTQYVLKTASITPDDLPGWTERNSERRDIPMLDDYKDFMRAYFEIHSCLDYCTTYNNFSKNKEKYYRLRLRVYGNYILIQSVNNILAEQCRVKPKSIQYVHNNKTAYVQYTALDEITAIFNWLTGEPYNSKYWQDVDYKLRNPVKYNRNL